MVRSCNRVRLICPHAGRGRPPAQTPAPGAARHDAARLAPRVGARSAVPGRRHQRVGLLRRRGRRHVDLRFAKWSAGCSARSDRGSHARSRRQGRTTRSGAPFASSASAPPTRPRPGALGADVRHPAPGTQARQHRWPTASSSRSTCRITTGASQPRPKDRPPSPASSTRNGRTTTPTLTTPTPAPRSWH